MNSTAKDTEHGNTTPRSHHCPARPGQISVDQSQVLHWSCRCHRVRRPHLEASNTTELNHLSSPNICRGECSGRSGGGTVSKQRAPWPGPSHYLRDSEKALSCRAWRRRPTASEKSIRPHHAALMRHDAVEQLGVDRVAFRHVVDVFLRHTVRMSLTPRRRGCRPTCRPRYITTTTWFLVGEVWPSPKRARRSKIGTMVPRRLITPRTKSRVLGSGVAPFQARISRTVVISTP